MLPYQLVIWWLDSPNLIANSDLKPKPYNNPKPNPNPKRWVVSSSLLNCTLAK